MENFILKNCRAILENSVEPEVCIIVRDGRIHSIEKDVPPDPSIQIIDADNRYVSPGLVEFHIHGCEDASVDYAVHQDDVLSSLKDRLLKYGVTTFVPALMADPELIRNLGNELAYDSELAYTVPGLYVEGPFVNKNKRGGILPEFVRVPDIDHLSRLTTLSQGFLRLMTVAPELPGIDAIIDDLHNTGAVVCSGHSACSVQDIRRTGIRRIDNITHLFNAMSGFSHKEPGLAMVPFLNRDIYYELNGDGIHVHSDALRVCAALLNLDRGILISDAVVSAGLPFDEYEYYGKKVISDNDGVRYKDSNTLVGSNMCINKVIRKFMDCTGVPLYQAVKMASLNPCRLLRIDQEKGSITPGKKAELVLFDEDMNVVKTFI